MKVDEIEKIINNVFFRTLLNIIIAPRSILLFLNFFTTK